MRIGLSGPETCIFTRGNPPFIYDSRQSPSLGSGNYEANDNASLESGRRDEWDKRVATRDINSLARARDPYVNGLVNYLGSDPTAQNALNDAIKASSNSRLSPRKGGFFGKGKPYTVEERRENGFYGSVTADGTGSVAGTLTPSDWAEEGVEMTMSVPAFSVRGRPYVVHIHPWGTDSSTKDFRATNHGPSGTIIVTVPLGTGRIQVLSPNEGKAYEGPISIVTPGGPGG